MHDKHWVVLSALLAGSAAFAAARTNTIVTAASDWTSTASFTDTSWLPGSGDDDTVIVPAGAKVTLSAADTASVAQFKKLKRILLVSKSSELDIVVDTGELELEVPMTQWGYYLGSDDSMYGPIVKKGAGTLHLASNTLGSGYDYYSSMRVEAGILKLNQNGDKAIYHYGTLTVAKDATLHLPIITMNGVTGAQLEVYVRALSGAGTVTTEMDAPWYKLSIAGMSDIEGPMNFSGVLGGKYYQLIVAGTAQSLSGQASTANMLNYEFGTKAGSLGVAKFGNRNEASSLGIGDRPLEMDAQTFRFVYLGDGETCNRNFILHGRSSENQGPFVIDAGAVGGLCFSSNFQRQWRSTMGQGLVLAGDGSVVNTFSATITDYSDSTETGVGGHTVYLTKEGTGTWFLSGDRGPFSCGISVNEGVLQYSSIAPAGQTCALGYATNLTDGTLGSHDTAHHVDYALRLGAPTTAGEKKESGRLEYTGNTAFSVSDREIAVAGKGGLRANGTAAQRFSNIYGISDEAMTLYLDGASTAENEVNNVSDGLGGGKLSITKEGSGKWILSGAQSWSGGLSVKGGELVVRNPTNYSWYAWTITSVGNPSQNRIHLAEFCLCDAQNRYLTQDRYDENGQFVAHAISVVSNPELDYGQAVITTPASANPLSGAALFDNKGYAGRWVYEGTVPRQDDPNSWMTVKIRLPAGSSGAAGYDIANGVGRTGGGKCEHAVSNYCINASLDGFNWDRVKTVSMAFDKFNWSYGDYVYGVTADRLDVHSKCDTIAPGPGVLPNVLGNVSFYEISGGGRLTLDVGSAPITIGELKVDASTGGSISGFEFAENGTLSVENVGSDTSELPFAVTGGTTFGNIAGWSLNVNGKARPTWSVKARNGRLTLMRPGTILSFR